MTRLDSQNSTVSEQSYNPRYIAYAAAHGKTPEEMLAHDVTAYPGGKMCGFILWISARWREWNKATGRSPNDYKSPAAHASFDVFIDAGVRP